MIVAGFGFRGAATVASLQDALDRTGNATQVQLLATAADKANSDTFRALVFQLGLPARGVDSALLSDQQTHTTSVFSQVARATGSLAEAAALAAAGPGARLLITRKISTDGMATCALAERMEG